MSKVKLLRDKRGHTNSAEHADYLAHGGTPYETRHIYGTATRPIMSILLVGKLHEEAEEIRESLTDRNEYADALQVLMDLARINGVNWRDVESAREDKLGYAGAFTQPRLLVQE